MPTPPEFVAKPLCLKRHHNLKGSMDDDDWDVDIDVDALVEQHRQRDATASGSGNPVFAVPQPASTQWPSQGVAVTGATTQPLTAPALGGWRAPQPPLQPSAQPLQPIQPQPYPTSSGAQPPQAAQALKLVPPTHGHQSAHGAHGQGQAPGWQAPRQGPHATNRTAWAQPQAAASVPPAQPTSQQHVNSQWQGQPCNPHAAQPQQWPQPRAVGPTFGGAANSSLQVAPSNATSQRQPQTGLSWTGGQLNMAPSGLVAPQPSAAHTGPAAGGPPRAPPASGQGQAGPAQQQAGTGGSVQQLGSVALKAQQIRDRWAKPKAHRPGVDAPGQTQGPMGGPATASGWGYRAGSNVTAGGGPAPAGGMGPPAHNPPIARPPLASSSGGAPPSALPHQPQQNQLPFVGNQQQPPQQQQVWQAGASMAAATHRDPRATSVTAGQDGGAVNCASNAGMPWTGQQAASSLALNHAGGSAVHNPQQHRLPGHDAPGGSSWRGNSGPSGPAGAQTRQQYNAAQTVAAQPGLGGGQGAGSSGDGQRQAPDPSRHGAVQGDASMPIDRYDQPLAARPGQGFRQGTVSSPHPDVPVSGGYRPQEEQQQAPLLNPLQQQAVSSGWGSGAAERQHADRGANNGAAAAGTWHPQNGTSDWHGGAGRHPVADGDSSVSGPNGWQDRGPQHQTLQPSVAAMAEAGALGGAPASGSDPDAAMLDVPLQRRMQHRRSQPPPVPGTHQHPLPQQPQASQHQQQPHTRQRQQQLYFAPQPGAHPATQQQQHQQQDRGASGQGAAVGAGQGQGPGNGGTAAASGPSAAGAADPKEAAGSGYWDSMFGAGARAAARPAAPVAAPALPPPARNTASPLGRRRPPLDVDDTEMARALLAGEWVELPVPAEEQDGPGAAGIDTWSGAPHGPGDIVLVPTSGANPGMMLHAMHARTWLYPKDLPVRTYQFALVHSALFNNTLVCLPTGLGKTLIAAVVMLNYYRWFPEGKIVFVAPTKPLVEQQMKACKEKTCIPKADIVQLTATRGPGEGRSAEWAARRVFFCTPQILENDIASGTCPKDKLVLVVVDECHRAMGKAAPVMALQTLRSEHLRVRVVGLSATPGSSPESVQEVIRNLGVSRVEFRAEEDADVRPHCHRKQVDVLEVFPDDKLAPVAEALVGLLRRVNGKLLQYRVVDRCDPENVGRFSFVSKLNQFKAALPDNKALDKAVVPKIYNLFQQAIFLSTLLDHLTSQGARMAADFARVEVQKHASQSLRDLVATAEWKAMRQRLEDCGRYTHPKMHRLEEVLLEHFGLKQPAQPAQARRAEEASPDGSPNHGSADHDEDPDAKAKRRRSSDGAVGEAGEDGADKGEKGAEEGAGGAPKRVIIFTTLRDTVAEIVSCLERHAPHIVPRVFVGQGARGAGRAAGAGGRGAGGGRGRGRGRGRGGGGAAAAAAEAEDAGGAATAAGMTMNQEEQRAVLQGFRDGAFNVLVATCIGEEGLDIPEVDLIVCYDSSASPTRQVQRMGRTGRHREGRVVYVLSAGKETDNYYRSQEEMRRLQGLLREASRVFDLSRSSPSMLPEGCHPWPVLLRLQEATAAVTAHQKQQQAAAKKQSGKRGAAAATANGEAAVGSKRRKGAAGAAVAVDGASAKSAAQLAAAARWGKRPPAQTAAITIDDDEDEEPRQPPPARQQQEEEPLGDGNDYQGGAEWLADQDRDEGHVVGGPGALPGSDAPEVSTEGLTLAHRATSRTRTGKQIAALPGPNKAAAASGDACITAPPQPAVAGDAAGTAAAGAGRAGPRRGGAVTAWKPLWASQQEVNDEDDVAMMLPDWMRAAYKGGATIGEGGVDKAAGATTGPGLQPMAASDGAASNPVAYPGAAESSPLPADDHMYCDDLHGSWDKAPSPFPEPEPSMARESSPAEGRHPPQRAPAAAPPPLTPGGADDERSPGDCLSPSPLHHIKSVSARGDADSARGGDGDGSCCVGGLWLSPQLTTALQVLLGPWLLPPGSDPAAATTGLEAAVTGTGADATASHFNAWGAGRSSLAALLQPVGDEEAAALVAAAGDHPLARLAAAFPPDRSLATSSVLPVPPMRGWHQHVPKQQRQLQQHQHRHGVGQQLPLAHQGGVSVASGMSGVRKEAVVSVAMDVAAPGARANASGAGPVHETVKGCFNMPGVCRRAAVDGAAEGARPSSAAPCLPPRPEVVEILSDGEDAAAARGPDALRPNNADTLGQGNRDLYGHGAGPPKPGAAAIGVASAAQMGTTNLPLPPGAGSHSAVRGPLDPSKQEPFQPAPPTGGCYDAALGGGAGGDQDDVGHGEGGECNGGDDPGFDPDNLVMTLDVVPLVQRKPPPASHGAGAGGGPMPRKRQKSVSGPQAAPPVPSHRGGMVGGGTLGGTGAFIACMGGESNEGLQDVPLALRKRMSLRQPPLPAVAAGGPRGAAGCPGTSDGSVPRVPADVRQPINPHLPGELQRGQSLPPQPHPPLQQQIQHAAPWRSSAACDGDANEEGLGPQVGSNTWQQGWQQQRQPQQQAGIAPDYPQLPQYQPQQQHQQHQGQLQDDDFHQGPARHPATTHQQHPNQQHDPYHQQRQQQPAQSFNGTTLQPAAATAPPPEQTGWRPPGGRSLHPPPPLFPNSWPAAHGQDVDPSSGVSKSAAQPGPSTVDAGPGTWVGPGLPQFTEADTRPAPGAVQGHDPGPALQPASGMAALRPGPWDVQPLLGWRPPPATTAAQVSFPGPSLPLQSPVPVVTAGGASSTPERREARQQTGGMGAGMEAGAAKEEEEEAMQFIPETPISEEEEPEPVEGLREEYCGRSPAAVLFEGMQGVEEGGARDVGERRGPAGAGDQGAAASAAAGALDGGRGRGDGKGAGNAQEQGHAAVFAGQAGATGIVEDKRGVSPMQPRQLRFPVSSPARNGRHAPSAPGGNQGLAHGQQQGWQRPQTAVPGMLPPAAHPLLPAVLAPAGHLHANNMALQSQRPWLQQKQPQPRPESACTGAPHTLAGPPELFATAPPTDASGLRYNTVSGGPQQPAAATGPTTAAAVADPDEWSFVHQAPELLAQRPQPDRPAAVPESGSGGNAAGSGWQPPGPSHPPATGQQPVLATATVPSAQPPSSQQQSGLRDLQHPPPPPHSHPRGGPPPTPQQNLSSGPHKEGGLPPRPSLNPQSDPGPAAPGPSPLPGGGHHSLGLQHLDDLDHLQEPDLGLGWGEEEGLGWGSGGHHYQQQQGHHGGRGGHGPQRASGNGEDSGHIGDCGKVGKNGGDDCELGFGSFNLVSAAEEQQKAKPLHGPDQADGAGAGAGPRGRYSALRREEAAATPPRPEDEAGRDAAGRRVSVVLSSPGLSALADAADDVPGSAGSTGDGEQKEHAALHGPQGADAGGHAVHRQTGAEMVAAAANGRALAAAGGGHAAGRAFHAPTAANITPLMRAKLQGRTAVDGTRKPNRPEPPLAIDLTLESPPVARCPGGAGGGAAAAVVALDCPSTDDCYMQGHRRRRLGAGVGAGGRAAGAAAGGAGVKRRAAVILDDSSQEPGSIPKKRTDGGAAAGAGGAGAAGAGCGPAAPGSANCSGGGSGSLFKRYAARTPAGAGPVAAAAATVASAPANTADERHTTPLVAVRRRVRRPAAPDTDDTTERPRPGAAGGADDGSGGPAGDDDGLDGEDGKPRKLRRLRTGAAAAQGDLLGDRAGAAAAGPSLRRPAAPAAAPAGANIAANRQRLLAAGGAAAAPRANLAAAAAGAAAGAAPRRGPRGRGGCAFIDEEAELSGDEEDGEGEGDEGEGDEYESSFVTDGQGTAAGGGSQSDAGGRSPASMLAIYRAPWMAMTQAPPSVVRPGDVAAMMFAQRRRGRGGGGGAAGAGALPVRRAVVDTPGASEDARRDADDSSAYGEDDDDIEECEEDEGDEGEEGEEEEEDEDPLTRRMARGVDIARRASRGDRERPGRQGGSGRAAAAARAGGGGGIRGQGSGRVGSGQGRAGGSDGSVSAEEEGEGEMEEEGGKDEAEDDEACGVCGETGHLMLCEGCDCAVHPACVGFRQVPEGDWHCEFCRPGRGRPREVGRGRGGRGGRR